ncbi:MAG: hypothetical protein JWQ27_2348, partial [Ferruginibacter sp.]|nr:hypothetical protein [Ferruginibacter sp.]
MKYFYPIALFIAFSCHFNAKAQTPQFAWTRSYTNYSSGYANNYIATDSRNGIYSFGTFDGPVMTVGNSSFTNAGNGDIILIKHDTTGVVLWAKSFGGPGLETATGICTDHSGNIIISGQFSNTISFGTFTLTSFGGGDIFVAKLNKDGIVLWAQRFGGNDNESITSLVADDENKLYLGGRYASTDMTIGNTALPNTAPFNIFYCKLDSNGLAIWAKRTSSTAGFGITGISAYTPTRVQLYGTFGTGGTVNFSPQPSFLLVTNYSSGFLVKIDSAGNYLSQYTVGNRAFSSKISKPINDKLYITGSVNMLSDAANKAAVGYMVASSTGGQLSHYAASLTNPINQPVSTSKAADLAISADNRIFIVGYNSGNTNFEDGFTISTPDPNSTAYNSLIVWEKDESAAVATKSLLYTTPRNDFFGQYFSVAADTIRNAIYAVGVLKKTGSSTDFIIGPDTLRPTANVSFVLTKVSINGYVPSAFPQIFAGNDTTICAGSTITIGSVNGATGGRPPYQYSWIPTNGVANPTSSSTQVTPTTSMPYVLQVQDDLGQIASDTIYINLVAPPATPTITASGPLNVCNGQSVTLTSSAGANYLWSTGATTQSISVTTAGNYSVTQTSLPGCTATSAIAQVAVNPIPATPTISSSGPLAICNGATVVLTSSLGSGYLWSTGATTQSITVSAAGNYSVTHTNSSGCTSAAAAVQVTVNPTPATPTITSSGPLAICNGATVVLTSSPGTGFLWSTGATT